MLDKAQRCHIQPKHRAQILSCLLDISSWMPEFWTFLPRPSLLITSQSRGWQLHPSRCPCQSPWPPLPFFLSCSPHQELYEVLLAPSSNWSPPLNCDTSHYAHCHHPGLSCCRLSFAAWLPNWDPCLCPGLCVPLDIAAEGSLRQGCHCCGSHLLQRKGHTFRVPTKPPSCSDPWPPTSMTLSPTDLPPLFAPNILASSLFPEYCRHISTPGPLYWLFPLPGIHLPDTT